MYEVHGVRGSGGYFFLGSEAPKLSGTDVFGVWMSQVLYIVS